MEKVRVHELAKELGVGVMDVIHQLKEMGERPPSSGISLSGPSWSGASRIEPSVVRRLKERFAAKAPEQGQRASQWGPPRPAAARPDLSASSPEQQARQAEISSPSDPGTETRSLSDSATAGEPPAGPIHELLEIWDLVARLAPDPSLAVRFLADQSKLAPFDVDRVRRVRNQCAHPGDQGWPQQYDLDMALTTARELRRRLKAHGH